MSHKMVVRLIWVKELKPYMKAIVILHVFS